MIFTKETYFTIQTMFKACANNVVRPSLNYVLVDMKERRFVATNGHIMRFEPFEKDDGYEGDNILLEKSQFLLTKSQYKAMQKDCAIEIEINEKLAKDNVYPNYMAILTKKVHEPIEKITLQLDTLQDFIKATPKDNFARKVRFEFRGEFGAMTAFSRNHDGDEYMCGMIMPSR